MGGGRGGNMKNVTSSNNNGGGSIGVGSGSGTGTGLGAIPGGARKIVQSLKEIVNCPEAEIYAMLKECNMDPNETVNRLLSQDTFHEVKSKREKKKETKETSDFRPRVAGGTSNRGRTGADRYAGRGSSQYSASDSVAAHARPAYKKDNGSVYHVNSLSSAPVVGGHNTNWGPPSYSQVTVNEDKFPALNMTADNSSSVSQPSSGYQSTWVGTPGQVSMADIVKMGKPISKAASSFHNPNQGQSQGQGQGQGQQYTSNSWETSEDYTSKGSMENFDSGVQHGSVDHEWPLIEQPLPPTSLHPVSEIPADRGLHVETFNLSSDISNNHSQREETQQVDEDDAPVEDHGLNDTLSASFSDRQLQEDTSGDAAIFENELYPNRVSYQQQHDVEHEEVANVGIPVESVTANLQKLSVQKEDREFPSERAASSVVIPDHLQAQSVDCSHLSFGSFRPGLGSVFPGPSASMHVRTNSEETPGEVGVSSVGQSDNRESEYYLEESLRNESDANIYHGTGTTSYDSSAPQPEQLKVENPELGHESRQYAFTSTPSYAYENSQHLNTGYSQSQTGPQMQNLVSFPNAMPSYPDSLSSTLLAGNMPPGRESDISYSPFPTQQSLAVKYGSNVSSISGPTNSMAEVLKTASFSSTQQPNSQTNVGTGPALPQHLAAAAAAHPYSQHGLHLPFISYPLYAQGYGYAPPNYQQAFAGNGTYHQNQLAAVLPQYKDGVSSLPQSASGYGAALGGGGGGGGGSAASIPGNYTMNQPPSVPPSAANLIYDDLLNAQYKDINHLMSLQQQNDSSGSWLQGPVSRTVSALPNPYYQQAAAAGFRQGQQPSQNYGGALGYPSFYHSQAGGISLDQQHQHQHQQQQQQQQLQQQQQQHNPRDRQLVGGGGSQIQQAKQPHNHHQQQQQLWQNNY